MRFDTIQPDCVKSRSFGIKPNSTKARKRQGYNMWSAKSVNTESDSRFLEDEKKIMLCFSLAPKQKEKEVLRFLRKPLKLTEPQRQAPRGEFPGLKRIILLWISILNDLLQVKSDFTHFWCFLAKPAPWLKPHQQKHNWDCTSWRLSGVTWSSTEGGFSNIASSCCTGVLETTQECRSEKSKSLGNSPSNKAGNAPKYFRLSRVAFVRSLLTKPSADLWIRVLNFKILTAYIMLMWQ